MLSKFTGLEPPPRLLAEGGFEEAREEYARFEAELVNDLRSASSPEDINRITRRLQGAYQFLLHLESKVNEYRTSPDYRSYTNAESED